jgi:hypothetical protein
MVTGEPELLGLEKPADGLRPVDGQELPFTMPPVVELYSI